MSFIPYLETTGPGFDLETFSYMRGEFAILPNPKTTVPFDKQGFPIPDFQQRHTETGQVKQATTNLKTNFYPMQHFIGTSTEQIHQPQFLGVNEAIYA